MMWDGDEATDGTRLSGKVGVGEGRRRRRRRRDEEEEEEEKLWEDERKAVVSGALF